MNATGTLSRATQIVYRVGSRHSSEVDTLTLEPDGRATWTSQGRHCEVQLPPEVYGDILGRLAQYGFKAATGLHGDAMADYQHEIEVLEGPKKKSRCTLRLGHEFGTYLGDAPIGMKEVVALLDRVASRVESGADLSESPDALMGALLRNIDFPYVNPHGEPGAFLLIDPHGQVLAASSLRFALPHASGLLPFRDGDRFGFVRAGGEVVIAPAYALTLGFSEGLAAVKLDGGWGFIDVRGELVIPARFTAAASFADGLACVQLGDQTGYCDRAGAFVPAPPQASQLGRFAEGRAPFRALSRMGVPAWGYIDRAGQVVVPAGFDYAGEFCEGLACVQQDDLFGFVDVSGAWAIEPRFTDAGDFHEDLAAVGDSGQYGYCDKSGTAAVDFRFLRAGNFAEGLAPVGVGAKTGFIDREGRMVIEPRFDLAQSFSEGLAAVRVDHKWGFIDRAGRIVIEPIYEGAGPFGDGVACVRKFADPRPVIHTGSKKVIINMSKKT
ncbi:WG repeat-containing protein [Nannocystis pusilla]|uniref:WG repeat-containing protein n=1 Tax=Nannocystis pusilla TaxID=889268 RepID=UPI003DA617BE